MTKKWNPWNGLLLCGLIMSFVFGGQTLAHTATALWGEDDMYWTPAKLAEPLSKTRDVFRLFISGKELGEHLEDGTIKGIESSGREYTLVADDLRVRLNHYHQHQVRSLKSALLIAPFFGLGFGFLLVGLVLRWRPPETFSK